jgi:hypothetical protein
MYAAVGVAVVGAVVLAAPVVLPAAAASAVVTTTVATAAFVGTVSVGVVGIEAATGREVLTGRPLTSEERWERAGEVVGGTVVGYGGFRGLNLLTGPIRQPLVRGRVQEGLGYQPRGPVEGPGYQPRGPVEGPGYQPRGPVEGPGYQPRGPVEGPGYQPRGPVEGPGYQPRGPVEGPGYQPRGPVEGPGYQPAGSARPCAPVSAMTPAQQQAITKIDNIIKDHLKPSDISGAVRDALGNPVPKPGGGYWDHMREVNEAVRGLRNHAKTLEGVADPAAQSARQRALNAIKQVEDAFKGLGI